MANEQNLRTPSTSEAREMQKKSAKARSRNVAEKKLLKDEILKRMNAKDWDEIVDGAIDRAKESDKGFEILRDTIGQKPVDKLAVTNIDKSIEELHGYFERTDDTPTD